MLKISPSVLSCDFSNMGEEIAAMERAGAELIHLDVMDGHFVPNISFGAPVIRSVRGAGAILFDVHLMISEPLRYIDDFAAAGADIITFHLESDSDTAATIAKIRSHSVGAGIVLKPATPAEAAFPFLDKVDMVLVMTVEPGFGGQKFMADMMPKVRSLRQKAVEMGLNLDIEVDGGVDVATAPIVVEAGANVLVAGSALYGKPDYQKAVADLRRAAGQAV